MTKQAITKKTLSLLIAGLIGHSLPSYADDSEIFFSSIYKVPEPNILLMVDQSAWGATTEIPYSGGSLSNCWGGTNTFTGVICRKSVVKDAANAVINSKAMQGRRIGLFPGSINDGFFIGPYLGGRSVPVLNSGEIDKTADMERVTKNANTTILTQKVLTSADDGFQAMTGSNKVLPMYLHDFYGVQGVINLSDVNFSKNIYGFRFDNILLKKPSEAGINVNKGLIKAELALCHDVTKNRPAISSPRTFEVYIDSASNAARFQEEYQGNMSDRIKGPAKTVVGNVDIANQCIKLDVTQLIRDKINEANWQSGNAIALMLNDTSSPPTELLSIISADSWARKDAASYSNRIPKLALEVNNKLIANNKRLKIERIKDEIASFRSGFTRTTSLNWMLLAASRYISNIDAPTIINGIYTQGPYHYIRNFSISGVPDGYDLPSLFPSPLTDNCQMTHIIFVSDGIFDKGNVDLPEIRVYREGSDRAPCRIYDAQDKSTWTDEPNYANNDEGCTRSFASWLARTSHAKADTATGKTGAFIRTHIVGTNMETNPTDRKFFEEVAEAGQGTFSTTDGSEASLKALQDNFIANILAVSKPSANGTVTLSPQSGFEQRPEVFYSLYKSADYDYWAGNIKGFKMTYRPYKLTTGEMVERAVLADWSATHPIINEGGEFREGFNSAWSKGDSGNATKGGVVDKLSEPAARKVYTTSSGSLLGGTSLKASSYGKGISDADLQVTIAATDPNPAQTRRLRGKGLLDFIRGYSYQDGGSTIAAPKKIGDSANNGVTLVSYGCDEANKKILDCDFNKLQQVALLATNDGFVRGYDIRTGKNIFEFMPKQMLPLIDNLQTRKGLSIDKVRSYGLDGRVAIYHDDANNNGYIDNGETAYAFVVSGRGGSYIYGINISNANNPQLKWAITPDTAGFSKLGKTWSVPAVGKVKLKGQAKPTPVLVFGGGYDETQDTNPVQHTDTVGNELYVVNATTGQLLWSTSSNMNYSIPGDVALLTDDTNNHLITDIFFGDMGGQLWRFKVTNGVSSYASMFVAGGGDNGIVASISGSDKANTRRFYQKPMIYKLTGELANYISVNIGTGYKAHPLVNNNQDRFYSFRLPLVANKANSRVIKDDDLPNADAKNVTTALDMSNGFKVLLAQGTADGIKGEKVVSNAFADRDRVVFNTYIPYTGGNAKCFPVVGKQRTYYFSPSKGISLLASGYTELTTSTLPFDVTAYCSASFCMIASSMNDLSDEAGNKLVDPQFFGKRRAARKTTWTDLFSPAVVK